MAYDNTPKSTEPDRVSMPAFAPYGTKSGATVEPSAKTKAPVLTSAPHQLGRGQGVSTGEVAIGKLPGLPDGNLG
jgi:hypothetical protein